MTIPRTRQQAIDHLRSGCEQSIPRLNELIGIHIKIDPLSRSIRPNDNEIVYRLRKVLLHIKFATSWQFDTQVMHVLAPEIRAADEQFDMIWKKVPKEQITEILVEDGDSAVGMRDRAFKLGRKILSPYIHPTPQSLLLAKEQGGLGEVDEVRYYYYLFLLLGYVEFRYSVSLAFLSQLLKSNKEGQINSVMIKMGEAFASTSPGDY